MITTTWRILWMPRSGAWGCGGLSDACACAGAVTACATPVPRVTSANAAAAIAQMHRNDTVRRQMLPTPRGTPAIDGVAHSEFRLDASPSTPEELDERRNALLLSDLRDVSSRLDTEHRYLALVEVLQQLSVVGGELDHVAGTVRAKCSTICSAYLRVCSSQLVE